MRFFIFLATVYFFFFNFNQETSWPQWAYLSCFAVIALAIQCRRIPRIFSLLWAWFLVNAIIVSEWRPATDFADTTQKLSLRLLAGQIAVPLALLAVFFYFTFKKLRGALGWGLYFGGFAHAFYLIFDQLILRNQTNVDTIGLMGNRSLGASFTCIWIFFILTFRGMSYFPVLVGILAVAISHSGISYLSLVLGIAAIELSYRSRAWRWIAGLSLIAGAMVIWIKPFLLFNNSRFEAWPLFFREWLDSANYFLGWGGGSFPYYGPKTQIAYNFMINDKTSGLLVGRWFLWAHNDWLQILLEFGIIGAVLSALCYFKLLKMAWPRPALFGALVAYGAIMLGNYPWHAAPTALIGLWLIFETLTEV